MQAFRALLPSMACAEQSRDQLICGQPFARCVRQLTGSLFVGMLSKNLNWLPPDGCVFFSDALAVVVLSITVPYDLYLPLSPGLGGFLGSVSSRGCQGAPAIPLGRIA